MREGREEFQARTARNKFSPQRQRDGEFPSHQISLPHCLRGEFKGALGDSGDGQRHEIQSARRAKQISQ
jgi:hypothetical protein